MAWFYLLIAGLFEVGWAIGLKYTDGFTKFWPSVWTGLAMVVSMYLLAVAARLNTELYGPGVRPPIPAGYTSREAWQVSVGRGDQARRSLYILSKRNLPYPLLQAFDFPDMHESCARRQVTTIAPQALVLLNSELVVDYARDFAGRLLIENPQADVPALAREGFLRAWGRLPDEAELRMSQEFIAQQQALLTRQGTTPAAALIPRPFPKFLDPALGAAITDFCHALVNSNEFLYVD